MLRKTSNKSVESTSGFSVTVPDIHRVVYREGEMELTLEIEGGAVDGQVDWLVYAETISGWLPPNERTPLPLERKREVIQNVSESLSLLGMKHTVVSST
jgi:hypothetical protein